ncbi:MULTISPECIES: hypothetical protein [unclassified Pseudomonas]|uniref:hypothetical protein n=1 Tax=unclassified Pseudomonas TaxID=196821 RepID=UPI000C87F147|nr:MULTISPECIES: hypothetical protein [unclassified Pseudomonas]PNA02707.1 hypothetical protein C1X28_22950 [Pseudomonas sp. FW305-BF15]PNB78435.1 hypothetical protein C1X30_23625 [Pseudomonas sp. FW305-BF6]
MATESSIDDAAKADGESAESARTRRTRPYPAASFEDALSLGEAIMQYAAGEKVRRLTLMQHMNKSPGSGATKMMITNSNKYGITSGGYSAEHLELTEKGRIVVNPARPERERRKAAFELAIAGVAPFSLLYDHYKEKRLPDREVIKDFLRDSSIEVPDLDECVDTFIVNVKGLDLLRTLGGAETLISIDQVIDELSEKTSDVSFSKMVNTPQVLGGLNQKEDSVEWSKICFYITPIGSEESIERKHADLFMSSLVQPALEELGLTVVRADHIGDPGMITTQVLEYLKRSKLAIADLSYLNPNVFYEVALRHALRLPVVQIIRKSDRLPFDVNQSRTLVFDTTDIYSLIPKLQTYRAEIANQARKAIDDPESVGNPISIFYPDFYK